MNESPLSRRKGTIGELLTQIRLLEYGIEPTIPLIDSGNDIIAIKGRIVKSIQVKTKKQNRRIWRFRNLREYDILVLVNLDEQENKLDCAKLYLLTKEQVNGRGSLTLKHVQDYELSESLINNLFGR